MDMYIDIDEFKKLLSEIYSAGYLDGIKKKDILEGFNDFFEYVMKHINDKLKLVY